MMTNPFSPFDPERAKFVEDVPPQKFEIWTPIPPSPPFELLDGKLTHPSGM